MSGSDESKRRERLAREIAIDLATAPDMRPKPPVFRETDEVYAEAKRQQENVRWWYGELLAQRDGVLDLQKREGLFDLMYSVFGEAGTSLLTWGQSLFVLDGDEVATRRMFQEVANWGRFFEESLVGPLENREHRDWPGKVMRFDPHTLLAPLVSLLLAGDRSTLQRIAAADKQRVFEQPAAFNKDMRAWREFVFDVLDLIAEQPEAVLRRAHTPFRKRDLLEGYDALVAAIAVGDAKAFEQARAAAEAAYLSRAKNREIALNWHGEGKIAQAATFDAVGTALCRLARWRGLDVEIDTSLYPAAFHA
jgi:hypothetical protein